MPGVSFKAIIIAVLAVGLQCTVSWAEERDSSLAAFEAALNMAESAYGPSDSTVDLKFFRDGIPYRIYYRSFDHAAELCQNFMSRAENTFGINHPIVSDILLKQSEAFIVLGRYPLAVSATERALVIRTKVFGEYHVKTAEALDRLGLASFYNGRYPDAATYCDSALTMLDSLLGPQHPQVAWSCLNLARVIIPLRYYDNAESLSRRAVAIVKAKFGPDSPEMADCLEMLGLALYFRDENAAAESLYVKALDICERHLGPNHRDVATMYLRLANVYRYMNRYDDSDSLYLQTLRLREKIFGMDHPEVAEVLHFRGLIYQLNFLDYTVAESCYVRALNIRERKLSPSHPDLARTLHRLGIIERDQQKFSEAEAHLTRALAIRKVIFGVEHVRYYELLDVVTSFYSDQGRYAEALPCAQELRKLAPKLYGPESQTTASVIDQLGDVWRRLGRFDRAEKLYNEELTLQWDIHGENSPEIAATLNGLAINSMEQGQYLRSMELLKRTLDIYAAVPDSLDPYASAYPCVNLGIVYYSLGNLTEAEQFMRRGIELFKSGPTPLDNGVALGSLNLGLVLEAQGRWSEADSVLRMAVIMGEETLGPYEPLLGHALNNLANLSSRLGRHAEAESLQVRAISILEGSLGPQHPEAAKFRRDMGRIYAYSGKPAQSLMAYDKFIDHSQRFLENVFPYSSEQQKLIWISEYPLFDHTLFSLALSNGDAGSRKLALEMLLKSKAMVIEAVMAEKQAAYCHYDDATIQQLDLLNDILSQIAELSMAGGYYQDSVKTLYGLKDSLEVEISRHCSEFSNALAARRFEVADIAKAIEPDAVLWEFARYVPCNLDPSVLGGDKLGPQRYLAFTIDNSGKITINDLGEASFIDSLILSARDILYKAQGQIYSVAAVTSEERLNEVTGRLYKMIFAPLIASSSGKQVIYIAPDGLLNLLPFEILPDDDGSYAIEKYNVSYLSSGRDLMKTPPSTLIIGDIFVLADPDFDGLPMSGDSVETKATISDELYGPDMRGTTDCLKERFNPLPYSRSEASKVISCFQKSKGSAVNECYGTVAAEEKLKSLSVPPKVVHLATHGFFCETVDTSAELRDNPLLRSGLALAGANRTIAGQRDEAETTEDGILTALEVSGLNLVGTELAVLSACESGVGDLVNGEGVFGLRRAFQHAGAQTVIISLWPIPDRETSQLMDGFYSRWLGGMSKRDALRASALAVLKESRDKRGCGHPLLWGGFILTGNPN